MRQSTTNQGCTGRPEGALNFALPSGENLLLLLSSNQNGSERLSQDREYVCQDARMMSETRGMSWPGRGKGGLIS
jgi:hypothetical protein